MQAIKDVDTSSSSQARSALITAGTLGFLGSAVGLFAIVKGTVVGGEVPLVLTCGIIGPVTLGVLVAWKNAPIQRIAALSTAFYATYLSIGILVSLLGHGDHYNLFVYLIWFFVLPVFNKLVNAPAMGRFLARFIFAAPLILLCCLFPRAIQVFPVQSVYLVVIFALSYLCFGFMLDAVTQYRESYIVERERAESLRIESQVLESISDCFISFDSSFKLVFINDAACAEFAVDRRQVLNRAILEALPGFFSESMMPAMRTTSHQGTPTAFETQNAKCLWYEMRCFPQQGGMSVYFRNITESVLSRRQLEAANDRLREQSNLLDKAQDAIFVQDMESRILYWNQGAERIFGWAASEVMGMFVADVFQATAIGVRHAFSSVARLGEWTGELAKVRKDGRKLVVESRCTLVRDGQGIPQSILVINTDITERKAADARIQNLAFHDALTGLPNRALLRDRLERAIANASDQQNSGALLLIDLDDFKTLNDTSGHDVGDSLLREVAARLTLCVDGRGTAARFGGDEFVVLLDNLSTDTNTAIAEATTVADAIVRACRRPYALGHQDYDGTASIGITLFHGKGDTADELLKQADLAMYQVKARGRNNLGFFDPKMESEAASRVALLADLKRAMQIGEFELHYQPQVDNAWRVVSCEALLRWRHPQRGMVPPNEFIPLAEADGLIVDLGYWVLDTACSQLAAWARIPGMQDLSMAVNVSIRQFLDARFVHLVKRAIRMSGANPHKLKLEITESFMMDRVDDVLAKMTALQAHGITFSMDDFGTGYSSLSQLKRLPLNQVKIDQSFVRDVLTGIMDASIVRTIIALGRSLNLSVIAEGVETIEQQQFLEEQGCDAYQGYLFSPARSAPEFESFVAVFNLENEPPLQDDPGPLALTDRNPDAAKNFQPLKIPFESNRL